MYISDSTRENLTYKDFFEDGGYKKYVYILVGERQKKEIVQQIYGHCLIIQLLKMIKILG